VTFAAVIVATPGGAGQVRAAVAAMGGAPELVTLTETELAARCAGAGPVLLGLADDLPAPPAAALWPGGNWRGAALVAAPVDPAMLAAEAAVEAAATGEAEADARLRLLAAALRRLDAEGRLVTLLETGRAPLGAGQEVALRAAAPSGLVPPRLGNDCFAMPQGVAWIPVETALARLRAGLKPLTGVETVAVGEGLLRVLAADAVARRSSPPAANAAVDGFGFAQAATGAGPQHLPLMPGRAAAGQPYDGAVPPGAALRILTGAILPEGVDTVVLEEDTVADGATLAFAGPLRRGANTRRAGEDVDAGAVALPAGHVLRPPDLALLAAVGIDRVAVHRRLRVAVLSTGDELADPGEARDAPHLIPDANRPMLLALAERWGHAPVDLGRAPDDPAEIAARLDRGAREADVILTSGGASAGDEDHVSRLLREAGNLSSWRIAIKPGRPLALALWQGVPVFGLPGNPVAAFVCALIFARPALSLMSGAGWTAPMALTVPAAFAKSKKEGRREYLRARLTPEGAAEVFRSEGSGRISGLSWAEGLVELPDGAAEVAPGTPVSFLPYAGFGV
jgi:molybdopterin molybdotransferase